MNNEPRIPKEQIAFWAPITHLQAALLTSMQKRITTGYVAKFQLVGECIEETAKSMGIEIPKT